MMNDRTGRRADPPQARPDPHEGSIALAGDRRANRYRSKTFATWIALIGGSLGLHRLYLYGGRDPWAWLHILPTAVGLYGVMRLNDLGQDDQLAWALIPLLGLMLAGTMGLAIYYGLMPDEKWNARFNPNGPAHQTSWSTIIGVMLALAVGGGVLMATIAYSSEHYFAYQIEAAKTMSR